MKVKSVNMSNTKFTPGPWEAMGNGIWSVDTHNSVAFVTMHKPDLSDGSEATANAKLIAAAPEMLEALEGIAKMDNKDFANSFRTKEETAKQIMFIGQLAKAAINKATE